MNLPAACIEPLSIRVGDSAEWRLSLVDYPASAGWGVSYTLVKAGDKITIESAADADDHVIHPTPTQSARWTAGQYAWQCRVSNGTDARTIRTGTIEILPDFAALSTSGMDARTHARRTLDALEAWIETHDNTVAEFEIAGRRMKSISIADLLLLRDRYRREVRAESGAVGASGRILLRM